MASRRIVDPATLLRVAPLVASSFSVWYSWDQYMFLNIFLRAEHRQQANAILPTYFSAFFKPGLGLILGLYSLSIGTGVANAVSSACGPQSAPLYLAGVVFSVAHFTFVPWVKNHVYNIANDKGATGSVDELRKWLTVHSIRSLLVDIPGWLCFALAASNAVQVVRCD
ncbi:hypothetical protein ACHAQA_003389 [Verticillium albo-atrum]